MRIAPFRGCALAAIGFAGATLACRAAPPARPIAVPNAARAWAMTLEGARTALTFRQYARADSLLASYAARYPESPGAAEASYWRAVARLDPGNTGADPARAASVLDAYRAADPPRPHYFEAGVLRALVSQADSLRGAVAAERSAAVAEAASAASVRAALVSRDTLRARDEELARARAEAADARAELDRVRRRLAAPAARGRRFR